MKVELITPDGIAFTGDSGSVTVPTGYGEITVLPHHIRLMSTVVPGTVIVRTNEQEEELFAVSRGVVEVDGGHVRILADTADRTEGLEEAAIELARQRAEELRNQRRNDAEGFAEATAVLEREFAKLATLRRLRSRRRSI